MAEIELAMRLLNETSESIQTATKAQNVIHELSKHGTLKKASPRLSNLRLLMFFGEVCKKHSNNGPTCEARGEWVMFMDDDNFAKPAEVSTFIKAARATGAQ
eukprot:scaffold660400_cov81-Prasinocladus_malaysianus.AAC.1